jgi:hypothetical protein
MAVWVKADVCEDEKCGLQLLRLGAIQNWCLVRSRTAEPSVVAGEKHRRRSAQEQTVAALQVVLHFLLKQTYTVGYSLVECIAAVHQHSATTSTMACSANIKLWWMMQGLYTFCPGTVLF